MVAGFNALQVSRHKQGGRMITFELDYENLDINGQVRADVRLNDRDTGDTVHSGTVILSEDASRRSFATDAANKLSDPSITEDIADGLRAKYAEIYIGREFPIYTFGQLEAKYPQLREPVLEGLLRVGETMNIIASSKVGKSWLVDDLALAFVTCRPWLSTFASYGGNAMIVDNELHPPTIADRLARVAKERGILRDEYKDKITICPLRGKLKDLNQLKAFFDTLRPGQFRIIILDAWYRLLPAGTDESDNGAIASLYNLIDAVADRLGCCFCIIHHSSKGNQGGKAVTDVGSGAGSQSRAVDCHLIIRPHEEPGVAVIDAATRSFPPVKPMCISWDFPVWNVADDLDPTALKSDKPKRAAKVEIEKPAKVVWTPEFFVEKFISSTPQTAAEIFCASEAADMSGRQAKQLLDAATAKGFCHRWDGGSTRKSQYSTLQEPLIKTPK
jgi:hypothetical protein